VGGDKGWINVWDKRVVYFPGKLSCRWRITCVYWGETDTVEATNVPKRVQMGPEINLALSLTVKLAYNQYRESCTYISGNFVGRGTMQQSISTIQGGVLESRSIAGA